MKYVQKGKGPGLYNVVHCSVTKSSQTLHNLMDCSRPGFPVLHCSPWVCSDSCPLSQWCHPTVSSSVVPFSSRPQSFLASGSFPMNQLFASVGQSVGASVSALPMNIQGWFPLGLTTWISLLSKGLSRLPGGAGIWVGLNSGKAEMGVLVMPREEEEN